MIAEKQAPLLLFATSGALLLGALGFQYLADLPPCEMCFWQRYAHLAVLVMAGIAYWQGSRALAWLAILAMLVAAGLGLFHAGVEEKWWEGITACTAPISAGMTQADMLNSLMNAPLVRCDAVPWSWLGISLAGWNALLSFGAAICAKAILLFGGKRA